MTTTTEAKQIPGFVFDDTMDKLRGILAFMESDVEDAKNGKRSAEELAGRVEIEIELIKEMLVGLCWCAY